MASMFPPSLANGLIYSLVLAGHFCSNEQFQGGFKPPHKWLVSSHVILSLAHPKNKKRSQTLETSKCRFLKASPTVLSKWLQIVKVFAKKWKCACLAQEIDLFAPNPCSLPWLVKGATQLCTSKKEYKNLDLTAAQYFGLVDHNDWSRWFAISSPQIYAVPVTGGVAKKRTAKLRHLILLSRVTYWAPVEELLDIHSKHLGTHWELDWNTVRPH